MKEQIRYLKQEEKQNTRKMYETIFTEDSAEFTDYYYTWKVSDNEILVMEDEKGYEVMMHLNPYRLKVKGKSVKVPYIVAVATRPDCRRKGKMYRVMEQALQDLQKEHCPFAFLLPANPDYYVGQGFVFTGKEKEEPEAEFQQSAARYDKELKGEESQNSVKWRSRILRETDVEKMQQAADMANCILQEEYDVYVERDAAYYERLLAEVKSEQGEVLQIEEENKCIGILAYGRTEQAEIKECFLCRPYREQEEEICNQIFGRGNWAQEEMQMMFRITDLEAFSGILKGEREIWKIAVTDSIVEANNGIWRIEWNPQGGKAERLPEETEAEQTVTIAEVTTQMMRKMSVFLREWV